MRNQEIQITRVDTKNRFVALGLQSRTPADIQIVLGGASQATLKDSTGGSREGGIVYTRDWFPPCLTGVKHTLDTTTPTSITTISATSLRMHATTKTMLRSPSLYRHLIYMRTALANVPGDKINRTSRRVERVAEEGVMQRCFCEAATQGDSSGYADATFS